jgi:hypothetical protein
MGQKGILEEEAIAQYYIKNPKKKQKYIELVRNFNNFKHADYNFLNTVSAT